MFKDELTRNLKRRIAEGETNRVRRDLERHPERMAEFKTSFGIPIKRVYTPLDVEHMDYFADLGLPGEYPFTRGIHKLKKAEYKLKKESCTSTPVMAKIKPPRR